MFLYQKTVDRSTLREGFQIPVEYHSLLSVMPGGKPMPGETRMIKILIDGVAYDAKLKNQKFDRNRYTDHADVVQIRYSENSPISKKLREVFSSTWEYVEFIKNLPENINRNFTIQIPEDKRKYLALSATDMENVFVADCITTFFMTEVKDEISAEDELDYESMLLREDPTASYREISRVQKLRNLDRSIGDSLKQIYEFRCQMTGERVGEQYDSFVVEAHHIVPFTESMNNDSSNIIILSPNYHRIVHRAKPTFDRHNIAFVYQNGLVEKVKLNKHLY